MNEWENISPEEYVKLTRHGWTEEGTDDYHLRNINFMIKAKVTEALDRIENVELADERQSPFNATWDEMQKIRAELEKDNGKDK